VRVEQTLLHKEKKEENAEKFAKKTQSGVTLEHTCCITRLNYLVLQGMKWANG
jgi:hypothetical protein